MGLSQGDGYQGADVCWIGRRSNFEIWENTGVDFEEGMGEECRQRARLGPGGGFPPADRYGRPMGILYASAAPYLVITPRTG